MKKFVALYLVPPAVIEDWLKKDPETRRPAEDKMRAEFGAWMGRHANMISGTEDAGKTKRISSDGVSDIKNDIMLCSFIEAESHEAAVDIFKNHPHLQIPQSSIEVMEVKPMTGQ